MTKTQDKTMVGNEKFFPVQPAAHLYHDKVSRKCSDIETSYPGRISSACLRSEAVVWLYCNGGPKSLDFYRLKDGDQITLEYTTTDDVECAFHLMSLLRNALEFVKMSKVSQLASGKISPEFSKTISDTLHVKDIDQCMHQTTVSIRKDPRKLRLYPQNWRTRCDHIASLVIAETNMEQYMPSRPPVFGEACAILIMISLHSDSPPLEIRICE